MAPKAKQRSDASWEEIRAEYVTHPQGVSLKELADAHGLNVTTVKKRAAREGWSADRKLAQMQVQDRVVEEVTRRVAEKAAASAADAVEQLGRARARILELLMKDLEDDELRTDEDGVTDTERLPMRRDEKGNIVHGRRVIAKRVRRRRPRADTKLVAAILGNETALMRLLLGKREADDPVGLDEPPIKVE